MDIIKNAKTVVVKVGTSTLTHQNFRMNLYRIEALTRTLSDLKNTGKNIVLVTSGAIGAGIAKTGMDHRPEKIEDKQALAAIGQSELMRIYEHFFSMFGHTVAQILVTRDIMENPKARKNAENTFATLLKMGCIPIVNENDSVAYEEIEFGDNDTLSAYVAVQTGADLLILLSDINGLYTADPHTDPSAQLITQVHGITEEIRRLAGGEGSALATGGMRTKLHAAEICGANGCDMVIANGADPSVLYAIIEGRPAVCTRFYAERRD